MWYYRSVPWSSQKPFYYSSQPVQSLTCSILGILGQKTPQTFINNTGSHGDYDGGDGGGKGRYRFGLYLYHPWYGSLISEP